jgi:hypothetical protein
MRRAALQSFKRRPELTAVAIGSVLILAGALLWFEPYLTGAQRSLAEIPSPPAFRAIGAFVVPPGQQACMASVAITPTSRVAQFQVHPARGTVQGGPPVELVLSGSGYETRARAPGGYTKASTVLLMIVAPGRALIGKACFLNRGMTSVLLNGTTEPRTVSRSATRIGGRPVAGDIALAFLDNRQRSLLDRLGEIFGHASNLTDRLVPVWLIWILAVLVAFGVPAGTMAAFYVALREDDAAPAR